MSNTDQTFSVSSHDDLAEVRAFIEDTILNLGIEPDRAMDMIVASNEAITNSFEHGYQSQSGTIKVEIHHADNSLKVTVFDQGEPFDPLTAPNPDVSIPLEDRMPGGLGVHMIREFTDDVMYERTVAGENALTMVIGV